MQDTISQMLKAVPSETERYALSRLLTYLGDRLSSQTHTSAGLAIKGAGSAVVKAGSIVYAVANGVLVTKAANTDMAALSGTVTNAKFNVFCHFIDAAGNLTSVMGREGAALANVTFPAIPQGKAMLGYTIINPTGTGNFVGGTTALDDATVVPNAAYVNVLGAFDPSIQPGIIL